MNESGKAGSYELLAAMHCRGWILNIGGDMNSPDIIAVRPLVRRTPWECAESPNEQQYYGCGDSLAAAIFDLARQLLK